MKNIKEKGITLVALAVTIIILLILAGITINSALKQNGLFQKAKLAGEKYEEAEENENEDMIKLDEEIQKISKSNDVDIQQEFEKMLKEKFQLIDLKKCTSTATTTYTMEENGIVIVTALNNQNYSTITNNSGNAYTIFEKNYVGSVPSINLVGGGSVVVAYAEKGDIVNLVSSTATSVLFMPL